MFSLTDWTSYVFFGAIAAVGLGGLWYFENFDTYKTIDPREKQFNEPELSQGTWRLGHLPARGAKIEPRSFVVFGTKRTEGLKVARVVALEGQKVEVKSEEVLVDGQPWQDPAPRSKTSRWDVPEMVVPRGCVFVLCDVRSKGGSYETDSRFLGPIPVESITHTFAPLGKKER